MHANLHVRPKAMVKDGELCCKTKTVNSTVPDTLCPCIQISPDSRLPSKGRREKRAQGKAAGPRGMHATQQGRNRQNLSSPSVQVCVRAYARPWPCTSPSSNNTSRHDTGHAHVKAWSPGGSVQNQARRERWAGMADASSVRAMTCGLSSVACHASLAN